jgi:tripartite-type tricarboxylate transporter receptor subunit TctC
VVVPFPAGGPSDVVARVVTEQMGSILGQSMVIENVSGAGGTIGRRACRDRTFRRNHAPCRQHGFARGGPNARAQPDVRPSA